MIPLRAITAAACVGVAAPSIQQPPAQFQGPATVTAHYVADVDAACRAQGVVTAPGWTIQGCHRAGQVWLPLPCNRKEWFADLGCHEIGHALGWRHP